MADPVNDGNVKKPECGKIASLFHMCSVDAPKMEAAAKNINPEGQKMVVERAEKGDYGDGIKGIANSVKARQQALNNI